MSGFVKYLAVMSMLQCAVSCSSVTEERGAQAIADLYGGQVDISKGASTTTAADDFQGKYLKITIVQSSAEKNFNDLRIPGSYCAAMLYSSLTPTEQENYSYYKVAFESAAGTHEFKFKTAGLVAINNAVADVNSLLINLQTGDQAKVLQAFNLSVVDSAKRAALPAELGKIAQQLDPISNYTVMGSETGEVEIAKQKIKLVRLVVRVEHAGKAAQMRLTVNPEMHPDQQFLYGLQLL